MRRAVSILRTVFLIILAGVLLTVWHFGLLLVLIAIEPLDSLIVDILSLVLFTYLLLVVFNLARLATTGGKANLSWRKVLLLDRKPRRKPILRHPESSTALMDLPPWLPQHTMVGHSLVTHFVLEGLVFVAAFIAFVPVYFIWSTFPGNVVALLFLIPLLVFIWKERIRKWMSQVTGFLVGASLSKKNFLRVTASSAGASVALFSGGLFALTKWTCKGPATVVLMYTAVWAVLVGGITLKLNVRQSLALLRPGLETRPVDREWRVADPRQGAGKSVTVCHLTDLHLTSPASPQHASPSEGPDRLTVSGERAAGATGPEGQVWSTFRRLLCSHVEELKKSNAILISGDITDTGAASEWKGFFDAFAGMEFLFPKVVILPGNHDVNVCRVLRSDDSDARQANINRIRFLSAADKIQGERAIVFPNGVETGLREWGTQFTESLRRYISNPPQRTHETNVVTTVDGTFTYTVDTTPPDVKALFKLPEEAWDEAFPMLVYAGDPPIMFVVLDSNMLGTTILNNAFGEISKRQLEAIERILGRIESPVVVALHHHMGNPPREALPTGKDNLLDRALTLLNPSQLLAALPTGRSFVAFNGHRHLGYTGVVDDRITVISGPSTTLGDAKRKLGDRKAQIGIYELWWKDDGNFDCFLERWL